MVQPQEVTYKRITNSHMPELPSLQKLYIEAFPEKERRKTGQLMQLLRQPGMHFYAVLAGDQLAGFYIYWRLEDFCFLEHIAIFPALRGQGFGYWVMQRLLQESKGHLVLEVERPTDETSRRRIRFYQGLGFTLHADWDYYQPPYQRGQPPVPLYLMTAPPSADAAEIAHMASIIKQQVYERFYE